MGMPDKITAWSEEKWDEDLKACSSKDTADHVSTRTQEIMHGVEGKHERGIAFRLEL